MKNIKIISIFIILFSLLKTEILLADRLLVGLDLTGNAYNREDVKDDSLQRIKQCKPDQILTEKTGNFETDECGGSEPDEGFSAKGKPNVSLEINLGKPSTGWGLMFLLKPSNQNKTKLINFPNDNETAELSHDLRFVGIPITYTWGDPELGKNGGWAIRLGLGPAIQYYDPLIIKTNNKKIIKRGTEGGGGYFFFSWDWGRFSLIWAQLLSGGGIVIDEIKNNNGEPVKISTSFASTSFNYSWYF